MNPVRNSIDGKLIQKRMSSEISNGMNIRRNMGTLVLVLYMLVLPTVSFAQNNVPAPCDRTRQICNPISTTNVQSFIRTVLEGALRIGIPIIALAIIYCGFLFVFARGNSEKITEARRALVYTLIGAAILLGSWAIAQLISETVRQF